jgi:hypothetical protein
VGQEILIGKATKAKATAERGMRQEYCIVDGQNKVQGTKKERVTELLSCYMEAELTYEENGGTR